MQLKDIKESIANKRFICPKCKQPIQKFEKFAETIDAVRDGFNIQDIDSNATRVTLICANGDCKWQERTEYPMEFLLD